MFETCVRAVRSVMPSSRRWPGSTARARRRRAPRARAAVSAGEPVAAAPEPSRRGRRDASGAATMRATAGSRCTSPRAAARIAAARSSASASLSRNPVAPASMAATTRSSSMKLVRAMTSTSGWAALIRGGRLDAVDDRHQQVHDDDIGPQLGDEGDRRRAVGGLADDLEVVVQAEEVAHAAADHRVVVDEDEADRASWRRPGRRSPGPDASSPSLRRRAAAWRSLAGAALEEQRPRRGSRRAPTSWSGTRSSPSSRRRARRRRPARTASGSRPASRR